MHARKFIAEVQTRSPSLAWLPIEMHSGHGGSDQVANALESSADQIAFLFETLRPRTAVGSAPPPTPASPVSGEAV